jgi:hypothetical protein
MVPPICAGKGAPFACVGAQKDARLLQGWREDFKPAQPQLGTIYFGGVISICRGRIA